MLGAGIGWLVKLLANWLVTLPWSPLEGPAKLLTSIPEPWFTIVVVVAGAVLGLLVAFGHLHESLSVSVSGSRVVLTIRDEPREYAHDEIGLVFRDGKQLVLLGRTREEIAREDCDVDAQRLADAFSGHGYPWAEEDPHKDEFRRWVPVTPGLPKGANALLKTRAQALNNTETAEDARELREELARLGVVVRDENKRQYWRMTQQ
ncbi:MAG: hypothetical protein JWQ95_626 [Sphaerisporangium sp.]|nr:hypothetical protein [Sphaerisporangium sp.]